MQIQGLYQEAGRSTSYPATAVITPDGSVTLLNADTGETLEELRRDVLEFGERIPGLPIELMLPDGALFIPESSDFLWPQLKNQNHLVNWLETHWTGVLIALVLTPLFVYWMLFQGIPTAARASVVFIPDSVSQELGEQTLYVLNQAFLEESEIPEEEQKALRESWTETLRKLDLAESRYELLIHRSESFGANAMALPNGTVVVTDDLIKLLRNQPDALTAVLLHEIGHVEHQHSLKLVTQSVASSLLFTLLLNDLEGIGELVLGAGSGLLQSAFSREMEREADHYAHIHLEKLGIPPTAFADAMQALMDSHPESSDGQDSLLKYFRTHPDTLERIEAAKQATH